jgi:hypothetical protein
MLKNWPLWTGESVLPGNKSMAERGREQPVQKDRIRAASLQLVAAMSVEHIGKLD